MNSNVYSIKHFLKKKSLENFFARNRKPLASSLNKGKKACDSFNEVNERISKLEQKLTSRLQIHIDQFNDVR